jgi:ArsR family transcriptional regulator
MTFDIYLFKALGEETKHRILKVLLNDELCACEIPIRIRRTQSNCSMHLAKLLKWDLIKHRRKGKMILYSIKDKRVAEVFRLLEKNK